MIIAREGLGAWLARCGLRRGWPFGNLEDFGKAVEQFSRDYWNAYLNLSDRRPMQRLRRYTGAVRNSLREMAEELTTLRASYREQWLRENRPYWLDSILARYDLAIAEWLGKSKSLDDALREYDVRSVLPNPEEFGLGTRPAEPNRAR